MSLKIQILKRSFALVKPKMADFVESFYNNLFAEYPQIKPLFAQTEMPMQRKHLVRALIMVVENLEIPEQIESSVKELGEKHLKKGIIREYYPMFGASLLKTFESYLKDEWTPEVKQAWTEAYQAIADIMLEGTKEVSAS